MNGITQKEAISQLITFLKKSKILLAAKLQQVIFMV